MSVYELNTNDLVKMFFGGKRGMRGLSAVSNHDDDT